MDWILAGFLTGAVFGFIYGAVGWITLMAIRESNITIALRRLYKLVGALGSLGGGGTAALAFTQDQVLPSFLIGQALPFLLLFVIAFKRFLIQR